MNNAEYHALPQVSSSQLKTLMQSPAHFYAKYLDPEREPVESTPSQKTGTIAHACVMEPSEFDKRYIVVPEGIDRRTKEGKQLWADLLASGREPVSDKDWQSAKGILKSVTAHPVLKRVLSMCKVEHTLFFADEETGTKCRARLDIMVEPCAEYPTGLIMDLKTTDDARPFPFGRMVWQQNWHIQMAHYVNAFYANYGVIPEYQWIPAELKKPHGVAIYSATESLIQYGQAECSRLLRIYADCSSANNWPSYSDDVTELELPAWAARIVDGEDDGSVEVSDAE